MEFLVNIARAQISFQILNPINATDFRGVVLMITRLLMTIGIPLAAIFIIFTGFKYVAARGDPKAIEEAHKMLLWTLIGTAVIVGAYAIATAVVNFANNL